MVKSVGVLLQEDNAAESYRQGAWAQGQAEESTGKTARLVQKDGVKYVQAEPFSETFRVKIEKTVKLAGGDENFARLDELRDQAKANEAFASWLQIVDGLGKG